MALTKKQLGKASTIDKLIASTGRTKDNLFAVNFDAIETVYKRPSASLNAIDSCIENEGWNGQPLAVVSSGDKMLLVDGWIRYKGIEAVRQTGIDLDVSVLVVASYDDYEKAKYEAWKLALGANSLQHATARSKGDVTKAIKASQNDPSLLVRFVERKDGKVVAKGVNKVSALIGCSAAQVSRILNPPTPEEPKTPEEPVVTGDPIVIPSDGSEAAAAGSEDRSKHEARLIAALNDSDMHAVARILNGQFLTPAESADLATFLGESQLAEAI